jgi:hypothetical protein
MSPKCTMAIYMTAQLLLLIRPDSETPEDLRMLLFLVTPLCFVPLKFQDGFIIVSSAEESRCYIDSHSRVIEALFGREALKRTLVLITKSEGLFGKKYQ